MSCVYEAKYVDNLWKTCSLTKDQWLIDALQRIRYMATFHDNPLTRYYPLGVRYHSQKTQTLTVLRIFPRTPLRWRHNERDDVSNHQPHDCLCNRLFRHSWNKTSKPASLAFAREIHRWPVNFPHKWSVTRKRFPFDDTIISSAILDDVIRSITVIRNYW